LPEGFRKPLGKAAGWFQQSIIQWLEGAVFDVRGGLFHADGCIFTIPKDQTSRAYRACFLDGSYEAEERALVREFVRPEDTVLELGACLGIVSCVTNRILADKTRHVIVEGNPFCVPTLHRNRELNQAGFVIENCVVSNGTAATFYLHPIYIVGGTAQRESSRPVRVPGRSLAELDTRYGPFTTLLMDIEGAEHEVLSAGANKLNSYRLVIVELHEWAIGVDRVRECREILAAAGLQFQKRAGITEAWRRE
jgi:FkbM family methyltransferase